MDTDNLNNDSMYLCECGGEFCGKFIPAETYRILADEQGSDDCLYIVHQDHIATDEKEIQRNGEWVLVQTASERN